MFLKHDAILHIKRARDRERKMALAPSAELPSIIKGL